MSDEPILELPPLNDAGAKSADPGDPLSPFEMPPFPDVSASGATRVKFELPPGFDDLDVPSLEATDRQPIEVPPFFAEAVIPESDEIDALVNTPDLPADKALVPAAEAPAFSPAESALPSGPSFPDGESDPFAFPEPVVETATDSAVSTLPDTAELPVESPVAEVPEPTVFHPDGSLERMVEALERTLPKPSAESPTTLRRASRTGKRYLRFILDNRAFLIDADRVREIGLVPPMTFLPRTPDWVRGLTNLRGEMLSVVDLRRYLGFGESVPDPFLNRLVVVTSHDGDLQTGLIVDRVDGFARVEEASLLPLPDGRDVPANRYLSGAHLIDDDVAALLDINELLNAVPFRRLDVA